MQVVKYFFEEPVALELLSDDSDPDARRQTGARSLEEFMDAPTYARGYLAASDLETGRIAASVLPESISLILDAVLPRPRQHYSPGMAGISFTAAEGLGGLREALTDRSERSVIICGAGRGSGTSEGGASGGATAESETAEAVRALIEHEIREALPSIIRLLETGCTVLVSEPSHDGHDWSIFSPVPLADTVRSAMAEHLEGISGYVIPFRRARAEHRFYFEQVDPQIYDEFRVTA